MAILTTIQELDQAQAQIVALEANVSELTSDFAAATARADSATVRAESAEASAAKLTTDLAASAASLADAQAQVATLTAANADLAAAERDVEKRASARLASMQASIGIAPPLPVEATASAVAAPAKAPLTGLARAIAANKPTR